MTTLANRITAERVRIWMVTFLGIVLAPVVAYFVCSVGFALVFITFALLGVGAWAFIARDRWWVPFPGALALGGTFYYGFKIPVYEMALLVCLFPLVLALATRWQGAISGRTYPPPSVFLLAIYLLLHWIASLIYNQLMGWGGAGNVTRAYMNAYWPVILFFAYYFFGNSKYAKQALLLMYLALLFRVGYNLAAYFNPKFMYIPGINFVPAGTTSEGIAGGVDLRAACPMLAGISLCYFLLKKGSFARFWHFTVFAACFPVILLGGGRVSLVVMILLLFFVTFLYRKFFLIGLLSVAVVGIVAGLNVQPQIIEVFPEKAQRTLTGLLIGEGKTQMQESISGSTEWHYRLQREGRKRWLETFTSTLIGHGIRPFSSMQGEWDSRDFEAQLKTAALTGAYENALWSILSLYGIVGLVLILNVLYFLLRDSLPLLWREKVCDYQTVFAFLTAFGIFQWALLSWIQGGVPSTEIMMGLFAKTLHDDQRRAEKEAQGKVTATENVA